MAAICWGCGDTFTSADDATGTDGTGAGQPGPKTSSNGSGGSGANPLAAGSGANGVGAGPPIAVCNAGEAQGGSVLLHTTLDDGLAIVVPEIGDGEAATWDTEPDDHFVDGAIWMDGDGDFLTYPQVHNNTTHIQAGSGAIDFCYKPFDAHDAGIERYLFYLGLGDTEALTMYINTAGALIFRLGPTTAAFEYHVQPQDYALIPDSWQRVTVGWSFVGTPQVLMHIDGFPLSGSPEGDTPTTTPPTNENNTLYIGSRTESEGHALGLLDAFHIFEAPVVPLQP